MTPTGVGISGVAVAQATDAMLQTLGGDEVSVVFPLVSLPNDPSAQLGMADPGVQQVVFSPVVVRSLVTPATGPRRRLEFLISGTAVARAISRRIPFGRAASSKAIRVWLQ